MKKLQRWYMATDLGLRARPWIWRPSGSLHPDPFQWASGYRMPIYNDNRRLLADPEARALVANGFRALLEVLPLEFDNIAGNGDSRYTPRHLFGRQDGQTAFVRTLFGKGPMV